MHIHINTWGNNMENENEKPYIIEFDGYIAYASTMIELQSAMRELPHIQMILVRASGEILYDVRDGWNVITGR